MPTPRNAGNPLAARLASLPTQPELVIAGGKADLDVWVQEGDETFQPGLSLWLDGDTGLVRSSTLYSPLATIDDGITEALEALVTAIVEPMPFAPGMAPPPSALPGLVIVNDATLAAAARALLAPFDVQVEYQEPIEVFEEAFDALSESVGADEDAEMPTPFIWDIDPALLPPLFAAADRYARQAPWQSLPDYPPLSITLGEASPLPGVPELYGAVLGGGGDIDGLALYFSLDDYDLALNLAGQTMLDESDIDQAVDFLRDMGAPVGAMSDEDMRALVANVLQSQMVDGVDLDEMGNSVGCFFDAVEEVDPTYLRWLQERGITVPNREAVPSFLRIAMGEGPRLPNAAEVAALTIGLDAVSQFTQRFQPELDQDEPPTEHLTHQAQVTAGPATLTVDLSYPAGDYMWVDEPEMPDW